MVVNRRRAVSAWRIVPPTYLVALLDAKFAALREPRNHSLPASLTSTTNSDLRKEVEMRGRKWHLT
jgi:hypothetical protein